MLTAKETELIRHALGLNPRSKVTYRNAFLAGPFDIERWRSLVERGYAFEGRRQSLGTYFHVTRKGFESVQRKGEKLGPDEEAMLRQRDAEAA